MNRQEACIERIESGSVAETAGLKAGEYVQSINGQAASDYIDWLWDSDGTEVELEIRAEDGFLRPVLLKRDSLQESWGIEFSDVVFDGIHVCKNDCVFCFMRQLPATARKALCMRDDDYRLSFLQGNFITLTNLKAEDKARILEQRISPLRLSFHAANEELRQKIIGKNQAAALASFDEFLEAGIDFHVQIVLIPGVNDGDALEDTLAYLKDPKRLPHVLSVGIVPVAYTNYAPTRLKELLTDASMVPVEREIWAKSVIEQVQRHQFAEFEKRELTWVYLADEFYIHAHAPFPLPQYYDGYPQLENGIGMVLNFIADVRDNLEPLQFQMAKLPGGADALHSEAVSIVCGELLTQTWLGVLGGIGAGGKFRLLPVKNRYFGGNVSVTGLLAGSDILRAVKLDFDYLTDEKHTGLNNHLYLIPDCIFNDDGITLDDYSACQIIELAEADGIQLAFYETSAEGLTESLKIHAHMLADINTRVDLSAGAGADVADHNNQTRESIHG